MATSPVEKSQLSLNDGTEYPDACAMGIGKEAADGCLAFGCGEAAGMQLNSHGDGNGSHQEHVVCPCDDGAPKPGSESTAGPAALLFESHIFYILLFLMR